MSNEHDRSPTSLLDEDGFGRLYETLSDAAKTAVRACLRGVFHRRRLAKIDTQIVISGTRGKSSLTRWIYELLHAREYDVYAKITGNQPVSVHGDETSDIPRGPITTLYENEREIRKHTPDDAMVIENQGITGYTTRMVNTRFTDPDVIVLSNLREDHLSTLGSDRYEVARELVGAIPEGTHVVNGEREPTLREYIDREVRRQGATVSHVTVPDEVAHIPGIESVYALNHVLAAIDEEPLTDDTLAAYRDEMTVKWRHVEGGRVYNAAEVNDVQSTEMVREALARQSCGEPTQPITPFLYLRGDRRGRTVSFRHYLENLYDREEEIFEEVHVAGDPAEVFKRKASFPVVIHETDRSADEVLDDLLSRERPVLLMGNTVAAFMREMEDAIEAREVTLEARTDDEPGTAVLEQAVRNEGPTND